MTFLSDVKEIVFLGPAGSYSEMAKDKFCKMYDLRVQETPLKTISQVIEYVDKSENVVGVIPVENSIEGSVRESIDKMFRTEHENLWYLSETIVPIRHCLLSRVTELYSITGLISHPQAIGQCLNFIHEKLTSNLNVIHATSTAEAARMLDDYNMTYAAIGSEKTAELYNLHIIERNINDDPTNQTRFVLIGKCNTPNTGNDKTSLAFSTENKSGALLEILEIFKEYDINLTYIDSRPSKTDFGEYTFLVDFDGHISEDIIAKATKKVEDYSTSFRIIGSYQKAHAN